MTDDIASARADVRPGDQIAGYRLEGQIGQGGMAVVYRAYDERLDRRVALKVLSPALAADTAFRTRFIRESRAAAAVDHPNIIPVYDAGDAGGCLFISMRYVQGGDVRALVSGGKPLPPARALNIVLQVASALDTAHARQLIHRDVKPANMLLDQPPRTVSGKSSGNVSQALEHVYLSDFGISKQSVTSNLTSTGQFVGTLDYIAPEQIEGNGIDGRADQYSLACAAYELLCGAPPFARSNGFALINSHLSETPPSARTVRPELPAAVDLVLTKAMDKFPGRRYATCTRFARDLGRALGLTPGSLEAASGAPTATAAADLQQATGQQYAAGPQAAGAGWPPQPGERDPAYEQYYQPQQGFQQQGFQQPGGPATPAGPGWSQYPPAAPQRRPGRALLWGLFSAAALIIAAVAVAIFIINPNGSGSSGANSQTPSGTGAAVSRTAGGQARMISKLLSSSSAARGLIGPAVYAIEYHCSSLSPGQLSSHVATIKTVAGQRRSEYARASDLQVSALPNGSQLKNDLLTALQASLRADNHYLKWAQEEQRRGCFRAANSPAFDSAGGYDNQAVKAKATFANEWNPVAGRYGLPHASPGDI